MSVISSDFLGPQLTGIPFDHKTNAVDTVFPINALRGSVSSHFEPAHLKRAFDGNPGDNRAVYSPVRQKFKIPSSLRER